MFQYLGFALLFGVSMFGWGRMLLRIDRNVDGFGYALTTVLGMAAVAAIGGVLNLVGYATGLVLNLVLLAGTLAVLAELVIRLRSGSPAMLVCGQQRIWLSAYGVMVSCVIVLLAVTTLIPDAYNYHDDYQKYLVHPVKMLQTGSVFGSSLSSVGKDVFGAQALFQAFFIHNLGIEAANVFDAFFCLLLGVLLLLEEGYRREVPGLALLAACLLVTLHPQYVNISSLYSAALVMMACVFLVPVLLERTLLSDPVRVAPVLGISLCYSTLVAMKLTNALFPVAHFSLMLIGVVLFGRSLRRVGRLAVGVPLLSLAFATPWGSWTVGNLIGQEVSDRGDSLLEQVGGGWADLAQWFSGSPMFYGASALKYTLLPVMLLTVAVSVLVWVRLLRQRNPESDGVAVVGRFAATLSSVGAALSCVLIFAFLLLSLSPRIHSFSTTMRYAIPFLIALAPPAIVLFASVLRSSMTSRLPRGALAVATLVMAAAHVPETVARSQQSLDCGSQLAFSAFACSDPYMAYNDAVLRGPIRGWVSAWQSHVPAGERLVAWMNTAFFLDFNRNEVHEVDISGLDNPWARLPDSGYLIVEHGGYATRKIPTLLKDARTQPLFDRRITQRTLEFMRSLTGMRQRGEIVPVFTNQVVAIFRFIGPEVDRTVQ